MSCSRSHHSACLELAMVSDKPNEITTAPFLTDMQSSPFMMLSLGSIGMDCYEHIML